MHAQSKMVKSRLSLPCWLEEQINSSNYKGLKWVEKSKREFIVPWKHASRHGWLEDEDAALFKAWAVYTKRFREERGDNADPKKWKANFRCAVNACPDIKPVKSQGSKRGKNAFRVFKFEKVRRSKKYVTPRNPGIKLTQEMKDITIKLEKEQEEKKTCPNRRTSNRTIKPRSRSECCANKAFHAIVPVKEEKNEGAFLPSCLQLPKQIKQEPETSPIMEGNITKPFLKQTEELIKDIKIEQDWCSPPITMKDILQSIPQLPKQGELVPNFTQYKQNQGRTISNPNTYSKSLDDLYQYDHKTMGHLSNTNQTKTNNLENSNDVLNILFEFAREILAETGDQVPPSEDGSDISEDFYASGSDAEAGIASCRPSSVASSLSSEELEKMLMDTENDYENVDDYGEDREGQLNSMDHFSYISTCTDPFLNSGREAKNFDIQAISEALRSDFSASSF